MELIGMNPDLSYSGVAPGASCLVPEDKKIFRVKEHCKAEPEMETASACDVDAGAGIQTPPWPVPNRYSA